MIQRVRGGILRESVRGKFNGRSNPKVIMSIDPRVLVQLENKVTPLPKTLNRDPGVFVRTVPLAVIHKGRLPLADFSRRNALCAGTRVNQTIKLR